MRVMKKMHTAKHLKSWFHITDSNDQVVLSQGAYNLCISKVVFGEVGQHTLFMHEDEK